MYKLIIDRLNKLIGRYCREKKGKDTIDEVLHRLAIIEKYEGSINNICFDSELNITIATLEADKESLRAMSMSYGKLLTSELRIVNLEILRTIVEQQEPITEESLDEFRATLILKRIEERFVHLCHGMIHEALNGDGKGLFFKQQSLYDAIRYCCELLMAEGLDRFEAERCLYKLVGIGV